MKGKLIMLAQNFKTAKELDLPESVYRAMQRVLVRLETHDFVHVKPEWTHEIGWGFDKTDKGFTMTIVQAQNECGTAGCMLGWINIESGKGYEDWWLDELEPLFYPVRASRFDVEIKDYADITIDEAAQALRHYLTTGQIDWSHIQVK